MSKKAASAVSVIAFICAPGLFAQAQNTHPVPKVPASPVHVIRDAPGDPAAPPPEHGHSDAPLPPPAQASAPPPVSVLRKHPRLQTDAADQGTNGDVLFTSPSPYGLTGVLMIAKPSWPYIVAKTGTADAGSAFAVFNANSATVFAARSDGNVGVGTLSPEGQLHLERADNAIVLGDADHAARGVVQAAAGTDLNLSANARWAGFGWSRQSTAMPSWNFFLSPSGDFAGMRRAAPATDTAVAWNYVWYINASGNMGLGTTNPTQRLEVNGNVKAAGNINATGDISADGMIGAKYQDVAEWVPATTHMAPGTVVVLNTARANEVMPSSTPYDASVAGVVSQRPGLILGESSATKAAVATTGRVKVHVDAGTAGIKIGDLLVTSGKPGRAMRSEPVAVGGIKLHRPGTILGKALQPLASGEGDILVLLSLQ